MDFPKDLENTPNKSPEFFYISPNPPRTSEQNFNQFSYQNFVPPYYVRDENYFDQFSRGFSRANYLDIGRESTELKDNTNETSNIKVIQQQQKEVSISISIELVLLNYSL